MEREVLAEYQGKYGKITFVKVDNPGTVDDYKRFCELIVRAAIKRVIRRKRMEAEQKGNE